MCDAMWVAERRELESNCVGTETSSGLGSAELLVPLRISGLFRITLLLQQHQQFGGDQRFPEYWSAPVFHRRDFFLCLDAFSATVCRGALNFALNFAVNDELAGREMMPECSWSATRKQGLIMVRTSIV
jgi:hypothetical protein